MGACCSQPSEVAIDVSADARGSRSSCASGSIADSTRKHSWVIDAPAHAPASAPVPARAAPEAPTRGSLLPVRSAEDVHIARLRARFGDDADDDGPTERPATSANGAAPSADLAAPPSAAPLPPLSVPLARLDEPLEPFVESILRGTLHAPIDELAAAGLPTRDGDGGAARARRECVQLLLADYPILAYKRLALLEERCGAGGEACAPLRERVLRTGRELYPMLQDLLDESTWRLFAQGRRYSVRTYVRESAEGKGRVDVKVCHVEDPVTRAVAAHRFVRRDAPPCAGEWCAARHNVRAHLADPLWRPPAHVDARREHGPRPRPRPCVDGACARQVCTRRVRSRCRRTIATSSTSSLIRCPWPRRAMW